MKFVQFIRNHKLQVLLVFFIATTIAFLISTIVLAVKYANLNQDTEDIKATEPPSVTTVKPPDMSKYKLPTTVKPLSYDLYLYPDLKTGLFKGTVSTKAKIKRNCNEVVMHTKQLNITEAKIDGTAGIAENDKKYELLSLRKKDGSGFKKGSDVNIFLSFEGKLEDKIVGLYKSQYTNRKGEKRYMATSNFEPTNARQAFPCFDEPNLKATFKVHLLKPDDSDYIALANYPQTKEEKVSNGVLVHFKETVPMSTYLAAFIVSDLKYTETSFKNGDNGADIPFRVYASSEQLDKTTYAGQAGKTCIEYFIKYFNLPYPLPKLDMVAIPDFVAGAMEDWGLVFYRETALLYNESTHSASNKQRVAEVVSHELAHSWFGNLVTMKWWDNLWLNEGFASYIQYKGADVVDPKWKMMDQFLVKILHPLLSLDATQGSHPIIQTVVTPDQINEVFDTISYNKGGSVLRMLEYVVGVENFQNGVTNYLKKFKYGNTVSQDLWDHLQSVVGNKLNVTQFMNTFTVQMGFPILTAKVEGNKYIFTQKRFLKDFHTKLIEKSSPLDYKWNVPVSYITDSGKHSDIYWFDHTAKELVVEKPSDAKWVKFNPNQVGYYRVNYVESDWKNLISHIKDMHPSDRTHLMEESFSIAESGELSYEIPLELTKYLKDEKEYVPWAAIEKEFHNLKMYLQNSQYEMDFKNYVISLLKPIYQELGWDDSNNSEDHLKKLARVTILSLICSFDHENALQEAENKLNECLYNNTIIPPNLRATIYKYGMVNAKKQMWDKLFEKFRIENDSNEKLKLMAGLAAVRNPSLLTRFLELAKDETYVRGQDYFQLISTLAENPIGLPIVWDYVRENWPQLAERFDLSNRYLGRMIPEVTSSFLTTTKLDEMKQFFAKYPKAGAGVAARKEALETVENNIKWMTKYKKTVEDWINKNKV